MIIFLRHSTGIFLRILKKTGTLPIGSIIIINKKIADKSVIILSLLIKKIRFVFYMSYVFEICMKYESVY